MSTQNIENTERWTHLDGSIQINKNKYWYLDGLLHRTDGPAAVYANGDEIWHYNGILHRANGPAVEYHNGDKKWFIHGRLHRTDGPAIDFKTYKEWWINGKMYSESGYKTKINMLIPKEFFIV